MALLEEPRMRAKSRALWTYIEPTGDTQDVPGLWARHQYHFPLYSSRLGGVALRTPPTPLQLSEAVCVPARR